jgi:hypothetical protein
MCVLHSICDKVARHLQGLGARLIRSIVGIALESGVHTDVTQESGGMAMSRHGWHAAC